MNKELFSNENILGLKDPNRPFPTGQGGDATGVGLLKWRMQSTDESVVPLTSGLKSFTPHLSSSLYIISVLCSKLLHELIFVAVNCWPSVSGNETYVSIEYEASSMFDLRNVVISVPLPALREAPSVRQVDGEWR
jgi:hypothetical protein